MGDSAPLTDRQTMSLNSSSGMASCREKSISPLRTCPYALSGLRSKRFTREGSHAENGTERKRGHGGSHEGDVEGGCGTGLRLPCEVKNPVVPLEAVEHIHSAHRSPDDGVPSVKMRLR